MLYKRVSLNDFRGNFDYSYNNVNALYDYLNDYDEIEFDAVAIRCNYWEQDYLTIAKEYNINIDGLSENDAISKVVDYLERETFVINNDNGLILYQAF